MLGRELTAEEKARIAHNKAEALKRAAARKEREALQLQQQSSNAVIFKSTPLSIIKKQQLASIKQPATLSIQQPNIPLRTENSMKSSAEQIALKPQYQPTTASTSYTPSIPIAPIFAALPRSKILVTLKVVSAERFKISMHPFHSAVVNAIKTMPSRTYDEKDRQWSVAFTDIKKTEATLAALKEVEVTIERPPENVLRLLTIDDKNESLPNDLSIIIDPNLLNKLFPYQKKGVSFGLSKGGRLLCADEMGLGKSVQALTIARYYKSEWPLLIVCPSSVKSAWRGQINTFLPHITRIHVIDKTSDVLPDARTSNTVVIMSYDQMVLKQKHLSQASYYVVIFDESHMLKDSKAKRTLVATEISKKATRVILLSGTPALSRPAELFSQIRLVNDRIFPNFHQFAIRYCDGKQGRFCFEAKGCTNSDELSAILSKKLMIRRLKADVLKDLPDKRREVVYLSGENIDSRMESLQKAKQAFEQQNKGNGGQSGTNECLLEYFNLTGIVKATAVCTHILDNYFYPDAPKRKILIFAHHQIVLDTIQVEVNKRGLGSIRIDGQTPAKDRGELCRVFQEDGDVLVAVLSMTAAGVGITLTAASVVVFAELHWNPGTLMQAEDRAHRVGQKDSVFVQYLVARNTADDAIWPLIQRKMDVLGQVNLSSDSFRDAEKSTLKMDDNLDSSSNTAKRARKE